MSTTPKVDDIEKIYATLCAASVPRKDRQKSKSTPFLQSIIEKALEKKEQFFQGDSSHLPTNWGVTNQRPWYRIFSTMCHEPLRMDIAQLRAIAAQQLLLNVSTDALRRFQKWITKFRMHLELIFKFKECVQQERMVYGLRVRVNTRYETFWRLFAHLQKLCDSSVETSEAKESGVTSAENQGNYRAYNVHPTCLVKDLNEQLEAVCTELEACLDDDEYVLESILKEHFDEENEHDSIISAISYSLTPSTDGITLEKITNAMYHWLGMEGRDQFIQCLPGSFQTYMSTFSSRELTTYNNLIKSVYAPSLTKSKSFLSTRSTTSTQMSSVSPDFDCFIVTPRTDGLSSYVALDL